MNEKIFIQNGFTTGKTYGILSFFEIIAETTFCLALRILREAPSELHKAFGKRFSAPSPKAENNGFNLISVSRTTT